MTEFIIKIAGHAAGVKALFDSSKSYCSDYLWEAEPEFTVEITQADLDLEREKSAKTDLAEGRSVHQVTEAQLEITAIQRKIAEKLFEYNTVLVHGSVVAVDGAAYLFTAKSGTGKSTHTRLWREYFGDRAVMVNDDKPFLRITQEGILACGSPWNGKHHLGTNIAVPLKAICILGRGQQNQIAKIPAGEAVFMLLQQSNRPQNAKMLHKYTELLDAIAGGVDFYRLQCNMEPEAAQVAFAEMSGQADNKE